MLGLGICLEILRAALLIDKPVLEEFDTIVLLFLFIDPAGWDVELCEVGWDVLERVLAIFRRF